MQRFRALLASKGESGQSLAWQELGEADLMEGDVLVRVSHSTINYKDGLAVTGKAPVIRRWPMNPRHRLRGQGRLLLPSRVQGWRRGVAQRLGCRRDAFRRLRADGAREGRLVAANAGIVHASRVHGDRHGGVYRHAVRAGTRATRREACQRTGAGDGRRRRRRQCRRRAAGEARLPGHRLHRSHGGSRLPQGPGRRRDHRSRRAFQARQASGQGAMGRCRRCGRQSYARQCAQHDPVRRHRRCLRAGPGDGSHDLGGPLHPARGDAGWRRFRHGAETDPHRGVETAAPPTSTGSSSKP